MATPDGRKNSPGPAAKAAPPSPGYTAATLAREWGVPVDLVVELGNGATYFTQAGRDELQAAITRRMSGEKIPPAAALPAPAAALTTEALTITRVFPWSTRVLCSRENGLEVVLQVKTVKFLLAGMVLRECICGEMGVWFYYGRLPRVIGEAQLFFPKPEAAKE